MSINHGNVFSAVNLSEYMYQSIPKESTPHLKNPYDAIALLSHACMLAVGFRLVGLGEDHKIEGTSEGSAAKPLPQQWNSSTSDDYAFRYAHSQSSLQYLLKISRLGSKSVVNCLGIGDDKVRTFDLKPKEFVSESSFPFTIPSSEGASEAALSIRKVFISAGRMTDAASLLKIHILQKVAPGLQKEGYEESAHAASQNREQGGPRRPEPGRREGEEAAPYDPLRDDRLPPLAQPRPYNDPLAAEPRRPYPVGDFPPPGFDDEYEINRPRGGIGGERRPLNIGERDLYPPGLGPHDPLRGGGFGPGGGGMHPTFDDPLFAGRRGGGDGGYNGQVPPGARYDPIGPGDGPPQGRGGPRFPGGGGGFGGGAPPNPFGGFGGNDFI
ncbi:MAG: hypothetical protein ASARMPREDX12_004288 [Alectoria sarmentosa]|nr:MAG: hypothetical protein ASARMPREDX12_004288 [Alectoria sarmentosa]